MPLSFQEFDRIIGKLQMKLRNSKHRFVWLEYQGKKVIWTERSHGRGDIGRVEFALRKQLRVNSGQLRDLANCPMTREAYIDHLKSIGVIAPENA